MARARKIADDDGWDSPLSQKTRKAKVYRIDEERRSTSDDWPAAVVALLYLVPLLLAGYVLWRANYSPVKALSDTPASSLVTDSE